MMLDLLDKMFLLDAIFIVSFNIESISFTSALFLAIINLDDKAFNFAN